MNADTLVAVESALVHPLLSDHDKGWWNPSFRVDKFDGDAWNYLARALERPPTADELARATAPYEIIEGKGNLLTTAGLNRIGSLIIAGGGQGYDNTNTRLGVGNSSTAAAVGQTDLQAAAGAGNRQFQVADATYPSQTNGVITIKSTFATGEANFAWEEWCTDNGTVAGTTVTAVMLNRKVEALGTKTSASAWALTITITLA